MYHAEVQGHGIQECNEFREIVQSLIDKKEIKFFDSEGSSINIITGTTYSEIPSSIDPRPITIFHNNGAARAEIPQILTSMLIVEVPKSFPYES